MGKINIGQGSSVSSSPSARALFTNTRVGSIGKGIRDLGNVLTSQTIGALDKRKKATEQDYLSNSLLDSSEQIKRFQQEEFETREDFKGFADDVTARYDEIIQEQLDNAPSEESRQKLKNIANQTKLNLFSNSFSVENKRIADHTLAKGQANIDLIAESAFDDPNSLRENLEKLDIVLEGIAPVLDDVNLAKFASQAKAKIVDRYFSGLMNTDIDKAIKVAGSDNFKNSVGSKMASAYEQSAIAQKKRINNESLRVREEQKQSVKVDRQIEIFEGKVTQAQLDKDLQDGLYDKGEYLSLSKELRNSLKTENSIANSIGEVKSKLELNQPFDTTDSKTRKNLDRYFEKVVQPTLTPENFDQSISSFIDKTSFIPSKVKSELLAGLHNGDEKAIVLNSNRINSITKSNPQLIRQFSVSNDLARAKMISTSVNAGMSSENAIKAADNMIVEKNSVLQEQRKKDFKDSRPEFDQDEVQSFFRNDPEVVPDSMREDWRTLYENYAVNLKMPLGQAKELAYEVINSQWGVSNVTGEPTYIKHAPEKYYNTKQLDPVWIEKDLKQDVSSILPETSEYDLSIDPDTIGTETPGYFVNYVSEDGIPLILRDNNKKLLLWRPDINTSSNAKAQLEKKSTEFNQDQENIIEQQQEVHRAFTNIGDGIL